MQSGSGGEAPLRPPGTSPNKLEEGENLALPQLAGGVVRSTEGALLCKFNENRTVASLRLTLSASSHNTSQHRYRR